MALHRKRESAGSHRTLTAAILSHDSAENVRDQDSWTFRILRREAERMIVPKLPEFLHGKLVVNKRMLPDS